MAEPIRVCEFVGNMNGGGVEAVVMNYYRHVDRTRVQFDFVVTDSSTIVPREEMEELGARVFTVPAYTNLSAFLKASYELFRSHPEWKIVHAHMNALNVFPLGQAAKAGVPVRISHSHSTSGKGETVKNAAKAILKTQANKYPTHRFACSRCAGEWLFGKGADFEVVYNAIDLNRFFFSAPARAKVRAGLGLVDGQVAIGHVGRFMPQKNHQFLLEAFSHAAKRRDDLVLLCVGSGEAQAFAENWVRERGLASKVRFLGQRDDVNELYQAFDAFALPSLYEGLCLVGVEAQAAGLPCTLSDRITREVDMTGTCQFLPIDDPDVWADAMCSVEPRNDVKRAAVDRDDFSNYDIVRQGHWLTEKYLELYREVVADSRPELVLVNTKGQKGESSSEKPNVGVLMSTYNGERYLDEQIDSIAVQEGISVEMFVRDDGSSDSTPDKLCDLSAGIRGCIDGWHVDYGGNLGFLGSFETLLSQAEGCDYYAFSDQDDFWFSDKIIRAIGAIRHVDGPALYASSVLISDETLKPLGENLFPGFIYSIPSELIRHRLAGHTMVWNHALQEVIRTIGVIPCWSHDQHVVLAALLAGAPLYLDSGSYVLHRRLNTSVTPGGVGLGKRVSHELSMLWNEGNKADRAELAQSLLSIPDARLSDGDKRFLSNCVNHRWLDLINDPLFDCGVGLGNAEARVSALLGRF